MPRSHAILAIVPAGCGLRVPPEPLARERISVTRRRPARARRRRRCDGGGGGERAALARALDAERIERRGRDHVVDLERGHVVGARQRVVHQRAGEELTGGVVDHLLEESVADAVRHAAVDLALDDDRVDHGAAVVHRDVAEHVERRRCRRPPPPPRHGRRWSTWTASRGRRRWTRGPAPCRKAARSPVAATKRSWTAPRS